MGIDKIFFKSLLDSYVSYSQKRHEIIKKSSDILRNSKQAIFALHRDRIAEAEKLIRESEAAFRELEKWFEKEPKLRYEGSYLAALEEYAEAKLLVVYLKEDKVAAIEEVQLGYDSYFGGICDFTGELVRKAISKATERKFEDVEKYRKTAADIMEELIKFNMTGKLRPKYDEARRNLKKLEEICYDIEMKAK